MKTRNILAFTFVFCCALSSSAQLSFSVTPGLNLNGARLGYRFGHFEPTVGFQFLRVSTVSTETGKRNGTNGIESYTDKSVNSGAVYLPSIGFKYLFSPVGTINSYAKVNFIKPILTSRSEQNGISDDEFSEDTKNTSLFGTQIGFGVEHYFSSHFSVGGEFGLTWFRVKTERTSESSVYNPDTQNYEPTTIRNKNKVTFNPTYAVISFNYYFSKRVKEASPGTPVNQ